jgi:hypothetical protein
MVFPLAENGPPFSNQRLLEVEPEDVLALDLDVGVEVEQRVMGGALVYQLN